MSLLNAFKKSLGLGEAVDDELLEDSADNFSDEIALQEPAHAPAAAAEPVKPVEIDRSQVENIFDYAVKTFKEALPAFLSDSTDSGAMKKKLYEGLDSDLKSYLEAIGEKTRKECESRWAADQATMRTEMDSLRQKAKDIEQQRFDVKQQQLSADRQRRALAERVHDLEIQLASLEAEREQFDLENKSLVNKLKVAGIHENEIESLQQQLSEAHAEILRMRNSKPDDKDDKQSEALGAENEALKAEIENLKLQLQAAAEKDRIGKEMLNGLQAKASSSRQELEEKDKEIDRLSAELKEADAIRADLEELGVQMQRFEDLIEKRDKKIAKLKDTCDTLREENASLKETIAANLKTYAAAEAELKDRISELESDPTSPIVAKDLEQAAATEAEADADEPAKLKISEDDLAAIEESFDNATWMQSEPIETPSMRTGITEAEFGYQAPTKKNSHPDNDAQLSLF